MKRSTNNDQPFEGAVSCEADEDELVSALQEYRGLLDEGACPDRQRFLKKYSHIAAALAECLDSLDFLQNVAPQLSREDDSSARDSHAIPDLHAAIGDFRIIREIGRGGMGVVYEAEQLSLSRRVALKVLPFAAMLNPRQLQRFKNEALAAAQLDHPHIVDVFGVGCDRGVHYYAMRYIDGHTLAEVVRQLRAARSTSDLPDSKPASRSAGRHQPRAEQGDALVAEQPQSERHTQPITSISTNGSAAEPRFFRVLARLAADLAGALEHAHEHGVVHRDIKPSNLILDHQGKPWVTDFGLAQIETNQTLTISGDLIGTLRYMSPEQLLARRVSIDHRTDIYSLGVSIYELITLQPAFSGDDRQELLRQISFDEPPAARSINPAAPVELETILLKSMAKNPADRYASAGDMRDDLKRFLADQPILAKRPSWIDRASKWSRRHRWAVVWAVVALGLISLISSIATLRMAGLLKRAEVAEDHLRDEKAMAEFREAQARRSEQIWSLLYQARGNRKSGWAGQREESLRIIGQAAEVLRTMPSKEDYLLQLRNESIACLSLTDFRLERNLVSADVARSYVFADSLMQRYAYINHEDQAVVCEITGGEEVFRTNSQPSHRFAFPILSPDGRFLALVNHHDADCTIWNVENGELLFPQTVPRYRSSIDFAADSRYLSVGGSDAKLRIFDLRSPAQPKWVRDLGAIPLVVKLSPDAERTAVCLQGKAGVELQSHAPDAVAPSFFATSSVVNAVAFHPSDQELATGDIDGRINVWDMDGQRSLRALAGHDAAIINLGYSHQGNLLFSVSHDRTSLLWDVRTGRPLVRNLGFIRNFSGNDDRCLLQSDNRSGIYEVVGGKAYRTLSGQLGGISSDGTMLAAFHDGRLHLHDMRSLRSIAVLPGACRYVQFSRDGQELYTLSTSEGVVKWPIKETHLQARSIGPPQTISERPITAAGRGHISADQSRLAWVTGSQEVTAVDLAPPYEAYTISTAADVTAIALSPDGERLVVNAWNMGTGQAYGYDIWNVTSQTIEKHLSGSGGGWWAGANFSHDGAWLVTGPDSTSTQYTVWRVAAEGEGQAISGASGLSDFSPDDSLLAIDDLQRNERVVRLLDTRDYRELAVLELPVSRGNHLFSERICFSGDGGRLAVGDSGNVIHVWDLQLIRAELAKLGLDWDAPAFAALPAAAAETIVVDRENMDP